VRATLGDVHRRLLVWAAAVALAGVVAVITFDPDEDAVTAAGVPSPRIDVREPRATSGRTIGPSAPGTTILAAAPAAPVIGDAPASSVPPVGDGQVPAEQPPTSDVPSTEQPAVPPSPDDGVQLRLSGRIVDGDGAGVAELCVTAVPASVPPMPGNQASAQTDADGRYRLEARDLVVNADPQMWHVSSADCSTTRVPGMLGPSGDVTAPLGDEATFGGTATQGVALRIHAVDVAGDPVAGFCVPPTTRTDADGNALLRTIPPGAPVTATLGCRAVGDDSVAVGPSMDLGTAPGEPGTVDERTVLVPPVAGDSRGDPVVLDVDAANAGENAVWHTHTLTATEASDEPAPLCAPGAVVRSVWATIDDVPGPLGVRAIGVGTIAIWRDVGGTLVPIGCLEAGSSTSATFDVSGPVVVQLAATEPDSFALVFFNA